MPRSSVRGIDTGGVLWITLVVYWEVEVSFERVRITDFGRGEAEVVVAVVEMMYMRRRYKEMRW